MSMEPAEVVGVMYSLDFEREDGDIVSLLVPKGFRWGVGEHAVIRPRESKEGPTVARTSSRRWKGCQLCKAHKHAGHGDAVRNPVAVLRKMGRLKRYSRRGIYEDHDEAGVE